MMQGKIALTYNTFDLTGDFSLAFWMKVPQGHTGWTFAMSDYTDASPYHSWHLHVNNEG